MSLTLSSVLSCPVVFSVGSRAVGLPRNLIDPSVPACKTERTHRQR